MPDVNMIRIRANLLSLVQYYTFNEVQSAIKEKRFNSDYGPKTEKRYEVSEQTSDAIRIYNLACKNVWSEKEKSEIKRFYNAKRRSGEIEDAVMWEKWPPPEAGRLGNTWREQLHNMN